MGDGELKRAVFDLGRVPFRWHRQLQKNLMKQAQIEQASAEDGADNVALSMQLIELQDELHAMLAQVLVSVPSEYLHESAPEGLDWSDPESLGWLKDSGAFQSLVFDIRLARVDDSKN